MVVRRVLAVEPYWTTTVPFIPGWIAQWNANVPAVANVWLNVAPDVTLPLSNDPSSAVTVCVALPVFVQVTLEPTLIVIDDGENPKSMIDAVVPAAAALGTVDSEP